MSYPTPKWRGAFAPCLLAAAISQSVAAQSNDNIEEITVRAHPLSAEGLAQPVTVLAGDDLSRVLAASIGETLEDISGVHSASFGQAVGRPVIRGLGGARVKVMEDRIDTLDVSVSSPDHLTTIEPFVAKSVEVLKGPSTLLYGSGAIGGVVDVHTGRIPHQVPDVLEGAAEIRGTDNADQRTAAGRLDGGAGNFAFHVDAFYRDADEYDIPGFAESARQRALEAEHDHDEDHGHDDDHDDHDDEGEEEAFGTLPGSQLETRGGAFGLSYIGDTGFIGLSVSSYEAEYGLPGHSHAHHHEEEEHEGEDHDDDHDDDHEEHGEEEMPILDLEQTRIDLEGGVEQPFDGVRSLNVRIGYNDYEHIEVEGDEGGTTFATEAWESRVELVHEPILGFDGAAGVQVSNREFSALGEEAFVQPVDTQTVGLFWVGQQSLGELGLEAGLRLENVEHDPSEGRSRSFSLGSASLGLIQPLSNHWTLSGQVDYSNRAPVAEELYSNGPHLATQTFEIGDADLNEETAANLSANLSYASETLSFSLSAYVTDFSDFIYEANTGLEEDELPVYQWTQGDARFRGFEADASWQALTWQGGALTLNAGFDTVDAQLDQGAVRDLPRISPQRWRVGASATWNALSASITYRQVADQNDVAFEELPTDGFDDLNVHLNYSLDLGGNQVSLFLNGRNLTDDEQRLHTSFIGQLAPQPGRTIEAGVRVSL